ncbi:MAG TPA: phosphatase PAP2 family protein [Candidatus Tenderia electrophaga]|uniref:Phosphatase PAP2 family protein n=1 Tax=Candidatus Tenderia electrophaga TaxID=1748243 RepID=A0A832N4S4_9GAMM|nr:phosphatase PAP2 family protein [Candidatus Tenderia electrophaga]
MNLDFFQPLLDWINLHPGWAGLFVFLVAFSESLAIVGLFMPGVVLMFGIGTLVALGTIEFWPTFWLAVAGAIAGDGLSFWLGIHFKDQLRERWPFSRYPNLFAKGESFFLRHGGKSILFGRFVGPVRPIIPVTAGMLGMSGWKFFSVNIISALAWAPAYLLPGVVFGASLGLAAEVASRLAGLVLMLLIAVWLSLWLLKQIYLFLSPKATAAADQLIHWGRNHKHLGQITAAVVDPQQAELKGLSIIAFSLGVIALLIFGLFQHFSPGPSLARFDSSLYHLLQGLRSPWADQLMVLISQLGDGIVHVVLVISLLLWLVAKRHYLAAGHWLAAALFAMLMSWLLKQATQLPRPNEMFDGAMAFSFPSAHVVYASCSFGFLAVLIARELKPQHRWPCYASAMLIILSIAFSRLYLGAHWFSDVAAGLMLGLSWVVVLGVAYRRHLTSSIKPTGLILIPLLVLLLFGGWHSINSQQQNMQRYALQQQYIDINFSDWIDTGWQQLPGQRIDTLGSQSQPLNLQWAGSVSDIQNQLQQFGWQTPKQLSASNALQWLNPEARLISMPLLPQVHDGRHAELTMLLSKQKLMLKLWPSNHRLSEDKRPIWIGYIGRLERKQLAFINLPSQGKDFNTPMQQFKPFIALLNWRLRQRNTSAEGWHGETLLLWPEIRTRH